MYQRKTLESIRVEEFIGQIISSAITETDFYKNHSTNQAINSLERCASEFSSLYRIHIYDKTFHSYESIVTFDNGKGFYVDVIVFKDDIRLNQWQPDEWQNCSSK